MKWIPPSIALVLFLFVTSPGAAQWRAAETRLMTEWGSKVTPDSVWTEYPRPQFQRSTWTNLNGLWSYAVTAKDAALPKQWDGELLVPFAPEAPLSGVGRLIQPEEMVWYRRTFATPKVQGDERTLLNFEAVDYEATVWLNGKEIGKHRGGHTPFSFDITDGLNSSGENELVIRVVDATEGYQLHGKQKLRNEGIWYTRVTGIWQTVWLEQVPSLRLEDVDYLCDVQSGSITVTPKIVGKAAGSKFRVTASFQGSEVATATGDGPVTLKIAMPSYGVLRNRTCTTCGSSFSTQAARWWTL